jgi:hypothetical protein
VWRRLRLRLHQATAASGSGIGDAGATARASAFVRNSALQHLQLYGEWRRDDNVCFVCGI